MELFGIGPAELVVVLVLILIFVGPQRLPEMAARLGRFMRTIQKMSAEVTREFSDTMHELEQEYDDLKGEWKDVGQGLDESARAVESELKLASNDAHLDEAAHPSDGSSSKPVSTP